jgi:hypothetical protein
MAIDLEQDESDALFAKYRYSKISLNPFSPAFQNYV